jgi:hypothetical protein
MSNTFLRLAVAAAFATTASLSMAQMARNNTVELERGARPDTTAQQRYQSAFREAHGGRKVAMEECAKMPAAERAGCNRQAQENFKADLARAEQLRRNPEARPINVIGSEIRTTESRIRP